MPSSLSLNEVLQQLHAKGYSLADATIAALPNDSLQSNDWRLDVLHQLKHELYENYKVLVIAVSSIHRHLKLVFIEILSPDSDFAPIVLLRRLFPTKK